MDFNGSKLGDVKEIIELYQRHSYCLINGHKASAQDIEAFIMRFIKEDFNYQIFTDGTLVEFTIKE